MESLLQGKEFAVRKDEDALSRQAQWQQGLFLPDQPCNELRRFVREQLKLTDYLDPSQEWSESDLEELGEMARKYSRNIQQSLGFTIPDNPELANNGWIFRKLLFQLGIKVSVRRQGGRGEQIKLYSIASDRWEFLQEVLAKREERRLMKQSNPSATVSTPLFKYSIQEGVDTELADIPKGQQKREKSPFQLGQTVEWMGRAGQWVIRQVGRAVAHLQPLEGGEIWPATLSQLRSATTSPSIPIG